MEIFSIFTQVSKGAVAKDSVRFRNTAVACFTSFLGRFGGNGSTAFPRPYLLVEGDCLVKISCQLGTLATLASRSSCYPFPGVHRCLNEGAGDMVSRGWCRCWYSSVGWAGKPTRWSVRGQDMIWTFKRHLLIFTNSKSSCTITESLSFEIVKPTAIRPKRILGSATFHGARKCPGYDLLPSGCSPV